MKDIKESLSFPCARDTIFTERNGLETRLETELETELETS